MIKLDEILKHQEKISKKIHEFAKIDKLLNDYGKKFSSTTTKLSELESELIIWQKEKEDLEKNPTNKEEVNTWNTQITKIGNKIKSKESELEEYQIKLDDINSEKESLRADIKDIEIEHIYYVKTHYQEYIERSEVYDFAKSQKILINSLDQLRQLWEIQDKDADLTAFIKFFNYNNLKIDLNLLNNIFRGNKYPILPEIIPKFINRFLKKHSINSILDPWFSIGSPVFQIETITGCKLSIVTKDQQDQDLIKLLYDYENIEFKSNDFIDDIDDINCIDIIIGYLQFDKNIEKSFGYKNTELIDKSEYLELFKSLIKLKDDGIGFFTLKPEFFLNRNNNAVISNLCQFSLYIDTVLNLPAEILGDSEKLLIIVRRKKPDNLFIGELNNNSEDILLKNLNKRVTGNIPQHGALTNIKSFFSFQTFLAKYESQEIAKETDLDSINFSKIVKTLKSVEDFSETEEDYNYIFLPLDSSSKTILSSFQFENDPKDYLQIFMDEKLAISDYVAHFFNTQLGIKIRESLITDNEDLFQKLLSEAVIYLPNLENQIDVINVDALISELSTRAENYKKKLWKLPKNSVKIKNELENKEGNIEEKIEKWVETLPFPLASIIWASSTVSDYSVKVKYLIDFFEAFSEFNYIIMLSALISDNKFFEIEYERCKRNAKPANWYYKPTFGTWNNVGSCLASTIRKLIANDEKRSRCLELFGNPDPEFLDRICNRKLYDLLFEVMNYRNQWDAHGPRVSSREYENRNKIMEGALLRFYQIISDSYENSYLLLPEVSSLRDGIYNYTVKKLTGTRGPFRTHNVETTSSMDSEKIYFLNQNQLKPVEIIPFIQITDDICYLYNSVYESDHEEYGKLRYVSYHYSEKAEIPLAIEKLEPVFNLLKPDYEEEWKKY